MDKACVIFDMDGTLIDSMPYWNISVEEVVAKRGVTKIPKALRDRTVAMTVIDSCNLFIKEFGLDCDAQQMMDDVYKMMEYHYIHDVPLKPGVPEYLESLKRKGVKMCTASATIESQQRIVLKRFGILDYFMDTVSAERVGVSKSDGPQIYDYCAKLMGGDRTNTAVFEDSYVAAKTAKDAGYYVVACCDEVSKDTWQDLISASDEHFEDWRTLNA